MKTRQVWAAILAGIALVVVGTAVALIVAGTALRDSDRPGNGGGRRELAAAPEKADPAPGDTGVARGGPPPKGQAPAGTLTVPRFLDAFNAEAQNPRLLVMLSPT